MSFPLKLQKRCSIVLVMWPPAQILYIINFIGAVNQDRCDPIIQSTSPDSSPNCLSKPINVPVCVFYCTSPYSLIWFLWLQSIGRECGEVSSQFFFLNHQILVRVIMNDTIKNECFDSIEMKHNQCHTLRRKY